jgi:predicted nucleotidyltransferase
VSPLLRVRFSTSHPKDITDEVLFTMNRYENICKYIHLPVQSGSSRILQMMNRTYTREWYLSKVNRIRELLPGCGISTDVITGFCTETEEDHQATLSLMEYCEYDLAYMFFYSERPGTLAARRFTDDVPGEIKKRRLQEVVALHRVGSLKSMQKEVGKTVKVLIEGNSKKSDDYWSGRSDNNKVVVFPKSVTLQKGDYADVLIESCTAGTLIGKLKIYSDMNTLIYNSLDKIVESCEKHSVKSLEVFGSATRNDFNENSDVDFLYEFDKGKIAELDYADNYFEFLFSLEDILSRKVDLLPQEKLRNPYLIKRINEEKIKIYG